MRRLFLCLIAMATFGCVPAWSADMLPLLGVGAGSGGSTYTGPGDVVSGAVAYWGQPVYTAAYAAAHGNVWQVCNSSGAGCIILTANTDGSVTAPGATACGGSACTLVTQAYDQTGNGHHQQQATVASMPTFQTNANGTCHALSRATSSAIKLADILTITQAQPFVFSVVAQEHTANASFDNFVATSAGNNIQIGPASSANNWFIFTGTTVDTASATDSVSHALQGTFNGATSELYIDGSATSGNLGNTTGLSANTLNIPGAQNVSTATVYVSGVGLWSGTFTSGQKSSMNSAEHTACGF